MCAATNKVVKLYRRQVGQSLYCGVAGEDCDQDDIETMVWQSSQIPASTAVTLTQGNFDIIDSWSNRCNAECAGLANSCSKPRAIASVYFDGVLTQQHGSSRCIYGNFGGGQRWTDYEIIYRVEETYIVP